MSRLRAAARDVRALGAGAPLRVAYDGSKALGGHTVVFDAALRRAPTAAVSRPVFALAAPTGPALDRARAEADVIAGGAVTLYGRELQVGDDPDWHAAHDPLAPGVRWPDGPWWQIDVRLAARVADIKWVWELGRHRHLVVLARALSGPHPEPSWAATLNAHLHSWLHHNPLEQGVHWASNLEVALRAMNWLEVIQLAGAHLDPEVRRAMDAHLAHSGTHLLLELPYTVSTMRNNHLIGDAVGLVVLAHAFPDLPPARRWARAGERLLLAQLDREVRPDGSMVEDSVSYHRFVLELLCRRALLGDAPARVLAAMLRAARFLDRFGVGDGPVPHHGDWDEGRALTASGDPLALLGSARLALALCGTGAPAAWRDEHDEVAWYAQEGDPATGDRVERDGHAIGGGVTRVARGPLTVWLKAGGGPWHGHADHTSVAIRHGDEWLVGDPGTGNYNGRDGSRELLRSSAAHDVLVLDGEDQLVPHRSFRWVHTATGRTGRPVTLPGATVAWGVHDAYRRLRPARRVARVVVVPDDGGGVLVADWVEGPPGPTWSLALPLAPGTTTTHDTLVTAGGTEARVSFLTEGVAFGTDTAPWSSTYGALEEAPRWVASGALGGPVAWRLDLDGGDPDEEGVEAGAGGLGPVRLHGDVLHVAGAELRVEWLDGAVELLVGGPEHLGGRAAPASRVVLR